ncbi:uncharacterized protein LOC143285034 [Babylonia areolata]|uniref:uncharacterized protein LOC143285034 n=1 Tax=Babylonia areolata TaxID=304850 RepID=UPI003FD0FE48
MGTAIKKEFSWRCFALRFHKTEAFCEAQWRGPRAVFVLYRLLMSAYSLFAFTHMAVTLDVPDSHHHFMAFLTNWTYLVLVFFFFWGAVLAVCFFLWPHRVLKTCHHPPLGKDLGELKKKPAEVKVGADNPAFRVGGNKIAGKDAGRPAVPQTQSLSPQETTVVVGDVGGSSTGDAGESLPWYVQVYWLLSNVIQDMAITVTIIYFGALYSASEGVTLMDMNMHGVSSIMIVIDVLVSARPVRLAHALYPVLYGVLYVIFSVIYWSQDHVNNVLYHNVLDWNYPGQTFGVVLGLATVGIPLLQLLHYGIYRLRLSCHHRIYGERYL